MKPYFGVILMELSQFSTIVYYPRYVIPIMWGARKSKIKVSENLTENTSLRATL
jgi:hypothetical protein